LLITTKITNIDYIRANLTGGLQHLKGKVDVLIFNPPYVPTDEEELKESYNPNEAIKATWAGGEHGIEPLNLLLPQLEVC
jgi:release factor glutamine methyltransferase